MLPAALLFTPDGLFSVTGGLAASIAVGAFLGQLHAVFSRASDEDRRRRTAMGGLAGVMVLIGLLLVSKNGS